MSLVVSQSYQCSDCGTVARIESVHDIQGYALKIKPPPHDWWTNNLEHYCEQCARKILMVRPEAIA